MNHLEQLVAEWYEYHGYWVQRNINVGKLSKGGYAGELDVVAYHPKTKHLIHIESTTDAGSWEKRNSRFQQKFNAGKKYIHALYPGIKLPKKIDQLAILGYGKSSDKFAVQGARFMNKLRFIAEINKELKGRSSDNGWVPERFPLLRMLQDAFEYHKYRDQLNNKN